MINLTSLIVIAFLSFGIVIVPVFSKVTFKRNKKGQFRGSTKTLGEKPTYTQFRSSLGLYDNN